MAWPKLNVSLVKSSQAISSVSSQLVAPVAPEEFTVSYHETSHQHQIFRFVLREISLLSLQNNIEQIKKVKTYIPAPRLIRTSDSSLYVAIGVGKET
jgi:hypothetical protein